LVSARFYKIKILNSKKKLFGFWWNLMDPSISMHSSIFQKGFSIRSKLFLWEQFENPDFLKNVRVPNFGTLTFFKTANLSVKWRAGARDGEWMENGWRILQILWKFGEKVKSAPDSKGHLRKERFDSGFELGPSKKIGLAKLLLFSNNQKIVADFDETWWT